MPELIKETEEQFLNYVKKMTAFNEALNLLYWDFRTGAPVKGAGQRSQVIGVLSTEVFKMSTSDTMAAFIASLLNETALVHLSDITKQSLIECEEQYSRNKKIPQSEYEEYVILQSEAETVWEKARENDDFKSFQPYLEKLIEANKKFINYWGYEENKYDTLLHLYEPGVTVKMLDSLFSQLKDAIIPLVDKIAKSEKRFKTSFLNSYFPIEEQREFSLQLLKQIGYDFEAGRLDTTVHPFAIALNPSDVRVTTRYDENDFRTAIFGTIHEGGHALYEQNISEELIGTPLCDGTSYGIHESQSLFYENFVGRHKSFWERNFPLLKTYRNEQFENVTLNDFYEAINEAKPSLIRIEADELTYCLHIIIRYEIEKALFNDEITVKDLPKIWNDKYEQYLGIRPENDREGVLQDIHWAGGSFGYFPSYALGYMYAAQFKKALLKDLPNFDQLLANDNLQEIKDWFREKVHKHGKMKKPLQILEDVTGEQLNANYLIDYLKEKYEQIYDLK